MKWLTIDYIHQHSRIDYDCEDALLEEYGKSAEDTVLGICGMTFEELLQKYGNVPSPIQLASLMLVEVSYTNRSPISMQNIYTVPYSFDLLIKPYVKLTM